MLAVKKKAWDKITTNYCTLDGKQASIIEHILIVWALNSDFQRNAQSIRLQISSILWTGLETIHCLPQTVDLFQND